MRCHFHLVGASSTIPDPEGIEVAATEQLPALVAEIIQEIESEDGASAADWSGWRLNVTTGDGTVLASIALDRPALNGINTVAPLWLIVSGQAELFQDLANVLA
jgi:hypothetical protein